MPTPSRSMPPLAGEARRVVRVELLVMLFVAAAPNLVFGLSGISRPRSVDTDVSVLTLIASLLAALGPAVFAIFLLWRDGVLGPAGFRKPRFWPTIGYGLLGFVCCIGAVMVAATIVGVIIRATGYEPPTVRDSDVTFTTAYLLAALAISITAGISEEIVYRAYGISRMEQAGFPRAALFVPILVWTAQHLYEGPIALLIVGSVGIPLVWLFWWKRSVWPLMIAHAMYDITIFLISASR
jgi:membrane protease YdiL (CAAX protease family)